MILYLLPFITAFTSWLAVWSAYMMLVSRSGKKKIVEAAGSFISMELSTIVDAKTINDPAIFKQLSPTIEKHLDDFLKIKLQQKLPVVATFMGESTLAKIKQGMMEEIEILLPEVIAQYAGTIRQSDNILEQISKKLNAIFDETSAITSYTHKIALITALQSFIIGIVISIILFLK
jgi:hypothetical protein